MKFTNFLGSFLGTTNTQKSPNYTELFDKLIGIGAEASIYPRVAEMSLNSLYSYRIFIERIDAIGKTLSGVHAKFGVALIGLYPIENELSGSNISDEQKTEICRIVSEAIQAELILNEVLHFINSVDKFLETLNQDKNEATQVANALSTYVDNLKQSITDLSIVVNTTGNKASSILGRNFSFNSFKHPIQHTLGQISKAETDLKRIKSEAENLREIFLPWIQERLDAVERKRKETGLKLQWVQLFHYSKNET